MRIVVIEIDIGYLLAAHMMDSEEAAISFALHCGQKEFAHRIKT